MSGIGGRHIKSGTIPQQKLSGKNRKHIFDTFSNQPSSVQSDGTVASGTNAEVNILNTGAAIWEQRNLNTQTIIVPVLEADGLDVGLDKTDNDGARFDLGITSRSKAAFTIGTDKPFFARLKLKIADVSGTDDCVFGFVKAEAVAAIDDYNDLAAFNVNNGDVLVETILDNAATTTTDTTFNWADNEVHELKVEVRGSAASFYINGRRVGEGSIAVDGDGAAMTAETTAGVPPFSFDTGEVVIPFFQYLHSTTSPGKILLREFECGYLPEPV